MRGLRTSIHSSQRSVSDTLKFLPCVPPHLFPTPAFFILSAYGELILDSGHFLIYSFDFFLWNGCFSFFSTCPMTSVPSRTLSSLPVSVVLEQLLVTLTI